MVYDPRKHHRRSVRLRDHDYAQAGMYFITVCTWHRLHLFGEVVHGRMRMNDHGRIVAAEWDRTAEVRANVVLDAFVVMPDHIHGIIGIMDDAGRSHDGGGTARGGDGEPVGAHRQCAPTNRRCAPIDGRIAHVMGRCIPTDGRCARADGGCGPALRQFGCAVAGSVPTIMRQFKSIVTKRINRMRGTPGEPVWQRGYWDHVIRHEHALERIRRYIEENPMRWHANAFHTECK